MSTKKGSPQGTSSFPLPTLSFLVRLSWDYYVIMRDNVTVLDRSGGFRCRFEFAQGYPAAKANFSQMSEIIFLIPSVKDEKYCS